MKWLKTVITVLFFALVCVVGYNYFNPDIKAKIISFDQFNIEDVSLYANGTRYRAKDFQAGMLNTMNFQLNQWWKNVDFNWKREWESPILGFVVFTDKGKLNFHGEWVVLMLDNDGGRFARLMTKEEKAMVERFRDRITWVTER
ncbi:MAG: hypothetical protein JST80_12845 [Bdellovibrionales bacterium]|nr:hypothetical protein [Bdellovibrionales bacterium]